MYEVDKNQPVLVTGANGYVAGHVVKRLLEEGVTVHAAIRDINNPEKTKHLQALADSSPGEIKFFETDLLKEGSYAKGMEGCSIVFHTASPFSIRVNDPQKDLVDPALLGTRNVLEEAKKHSSVQRVVLTSSCAAIYGDNADIQHASGGTLTEDVWNETSSLDHQPYCYSKTVAEKEAWKVAKSQSQWRLVVVNPGLVIGPGISPNSTSESYKLVQQMGDGTLKMGAPRLGFGVVDVRDLAEAHLAAAYIPDAEGRHIITGHATDIFSMAQTLIPKYGSKYPIPRKAMPKWLLWLVGPLVDSAFTRRFIARNVDVEWRGDNSKSIQKLGIKYRPLEESMVDFFAQLAESGKLQKS